MSNSARPATDVLIVGAGLAGLMAARRLMESGRRVIVVEREPVAGGRLATGRVGAGRADLGAQFFTVRSPEFQDAVDRWLADGLVFEWARGWSAGFLEGSPADGFPRYAVRDGFAALAGSLAAGLDVRQSAWLTEVVPVAGRWMANDQQGGTYESSALILTPPVPESLALLSESGTELPPSERAVLEAITYGPCLCGAIEVNAEASLLQPGVLQRPNHAISWIADNKRKGISPHANILTVHAGVEASIARWEQSDEAILAWMRQELEPFLPAGTVVGQGLLKRWPYAIPLTTHPDRCFVSTLPTPLVFAGDAFNGPRVEGASLSGWAAADAVHAILSRTD